MIKYEVCEDSSKTNLAGVLLKLGLAGQGTAKNEAYMKRGLREACLKPGPGESLF